MKFLDPAGTKTGALLPTGQVRDTLEIPELGPIEATILDVSNPLVVVRASDLGLAGTELPAEVDANERASRLLEAIRGAAAVKMGFASDLADATANSPAVPKVGFVTAPTSFTDIAGRCVEAGAMDICARVISVFKCHKACPLTASSAISVAAMPEGSIVHKVMAAGQPAPIPRPGVSPAEAKLAKYCPECGAKLEHEGGCVTCRDCGYSKCG